MPKGRIRIRLKAYDHRLIDETCQKLVDAAIKTGASIIGPVPLPTKKEVYVVNKPLE
ncbi:MAG: 30S ribosomal protein S10 [Candidatus Roizmanbacteria bacterium GW2011_GWA2_37_7]|uniref:30S ribosomal protein S10 n=1 Tax=Candidatus Roizmanbacteria bacterium GW2011_GWA2_37_7 TaxID=1618481 RepID=A0A0G0HIB1_9BACT|nr:MAG: 30S ribosomal protein S10 [Candidatus Roizmanbacteria bacterium GW2011_GWA2_37_7]